MSIPQYQEFMTPALNALKDGKNKHISEIENIVAPILGITAQDRKETMTSGNRSVLRSRIYWALYYMYRAKLIDKPERAIYTITPIGKQALMSGQKIDVKFLEKYPSFREFLNISHTDEKKQNIDIPNDEDVDPTTRISNAIEDFNKRTRQDLLDQLKRVDYLHFEHICLILMKAMGYGEHFSLTPKSHDGGIDGIIDEDALGLDKIYLQAKRYTDNKVNDKEMQNFIGALSTASVNKGVFITTSTFSDKAIDRSLKILGKSIRLIDGNEMADLMLKYNVGVRIAKTYQIKELDWAFFSEEEES